MPTEPTWDLALVGANATAEYSSGSVGVDTKSLPEVPVPKECFLFRGELVVSLNVLREQLVLE